MSKKYFALLLMAVMMLFAVNAVAAGADCPANKYGHTLGIVDETDSTCTTPGYTKGWWCTSCGAPYDPVTMGDVYNPEWYTAPVQKELAYHTLVPKGEIAATCTAPGWTAGEWCTECKQPCTPETMPYESQYYTNVVEIPQLKHTWKYDVYGKEATCTEGAYTPGHWCEECGSAYDGVTPGVDADGNELKVPQKIADKLNHEWWRNPGYPATCTEKGMKPYDYCHLCGIEYDADSEEYKPVGGCVEPEEIPALDHKWERKEIAPTCTEVGYFLGDWCEVCGDPYDGPADDDHIVPRELPALGHEWWRNPGYDPTCTEPGMEPYDYCHVCGIDYDDKFNVVGCVEPKEIPAKDHDWVLLSLPATCTVSGWTDGHWCAVCNDRYVGDPADDKLVIPVAVEADGHDWNDGVVTNWGSCTEDKVILYTCKVCNDPDNWYIDNLGKQHKFDIYGKCECGVSCNHTGNWVEGRCNVCGTVCAHKWAGTEGNRYCTICDVTCKKCVFKVTTLDVGSCTTKGNYLLECYVCGFTKTKSDYAHNYVLTIKPATCYKPSMTAMVCANVNCNAVKDDKWTPVEGSTPLNHPQSMWIIDKSRPYQAATCDKDGSAYVICECGYRFAKEQPIKALGHDLNVRVTVNFPATCTKAEGYGHPCNRCGKDIRVGDKVGGAPATKVHNYVYQDKAPTCTAAGYKNLSVCTMCNASIKGADYQELVPAHVWGAPTVLAEGSCTVDRVVYVKCTLCPITEVQNKGPQHNYVPFTGYKAATCASAAKGLMICDNCDKTIDAGLIEGKTYNHNWVEDYVKYGTCLDTASAEAKKSYVGTFCSVCEMQKPGTDKEEIKVEPKHTYVKNYEKTDGKGNLYYKPATCDANGWVWVEKCSVCGQKFGCVMPIEPALKHNWSKEQEIPADCLHGLRWGKICANCGKIDAKEIDATKGNHVYEEYKKEATCTIPGEYYEARCKICGQQRPGSKHEVIPVHMSTVNTTLVKDATCTANGYQWLKCTVCGWTELDTIKGGHDWDETTKVITKEATCATKGEYKITCAKCDKVDKQPIPATGKHNYVADTRFAATCTEPAKYGKLCTVCGKEAPNTTALTVGDALGHNVVVNKEYVDANGKVVYVAPTCTKAGFGYKTCTRCNYNEGLVRLPATGHKWSENKMNAAETVKYHTCENCGKHEIVQVYGKYDLSDVCATFEHSSAALKAVAATCTETGLTEGAKCSVCDQILVEQKVVPALGHTEVEIPAVAATCTETGLTAGKKCSVCDKITVAQEVVEKIAHPFNDAEKCPVCGEANPDYVNHVHEYTVKWSLHPTDKTKKVATYTCVNMVGGKVCTHTYTEEYGLFETVSK